MRAAIRLAAASAIACMLTSGAHAPASQSAMSPAWVVKWTDDLAFARRTLLDEHPSPFDAIAPGELDAAFDSLTGALPRLTHREAIVALACIVARLKDGHTRVTLPLADGVNFMQGHSATARPALPEMLFHQYPLRFTIDADGIWVERVAQGTEYLLGARLVAIDGHGTEEIVERLRPTIRADNEMQTLEHLPMHMALAELLAARGVVDDAALARFEFELRDGRRETIAVAPVPEGGRVAWVRAGDVAGRPLPLARRGNERNFWVTYLPDRHLVYLQFNTVYDEPEQTIRQLSTRLSKMLAQAPDAALVIDLRRNRGGDQSLALPLLHAVLRSPQNRAGQLFTIIGRTTFSAAMTFALDMEKHTQTLFVGEPTGSKPNHYGDSRKFVLPNSGITLRVSTLYWQSDPRDERPWIAPHIAAPPDFDDELVGVDPALATVEALLAGDRSVGIGGGWVGNLLPSSYGNDSMLRVEPSPSGMHAFVDIPQLGIENLAPDDLALTPGVVEFELPVEDERILYRLESRGPWIVGAADVGSVRYPVILRRESTATQP